MLSFFGLFGVYYSLQYLSLSDATVLTFLAPMFTIATGSIFLGEKMNWKQAVAGRMFTFLYLSLTRSS
jgi:drug/metabolite transporter (DMT)-like permease